MRVESWGPVPVSADRQDTALHLEVAEDGAGAEQSSDQLSLQ
jgi:hypothetical protein